VVRILDDQVDPFSRHLFAGSGYVLGEFACPPAADRWREENWIGTRVHVVLPYTPVCITAAGHEPLVSTANEVLVYDAGVHYRRRMVGPAGDRCLFFELSDDLAEELRAGSAASRGRPALRHAPLAAGAYAEHRLLRALLRGGHGDAAGADEHALVLLAGVTGPVTGSCGGSAAAGWRRAVEEVKAALAAEPGRAWTLAGLAALVHYSPFALARAFRRLTGYTVHGFGQQLRLRASVDRVLEPSTTLADVAVAAGFSSHSHYTHAFRRAFGRTPTQLRGAATRRGGRAAGQVPTT